MDLKQLTSTEQMILDELRDIREDFHKQLNRLNAKIDRIEEAVAKPDDEKKSDPVRRDSDT
jgi:predicted phage gp36 major capsid-like protein